MKKVKENQSMQRVLKSGLIYKQQVTICGFPLWLAMANLAKNWLNNFFITRAMLRLVWPSILLQSARDRVETAAETVTASRLWSAMSVKQHK